MGFFKAYVKVVVTAFKLLFVLDHILGLRNEMLFCPIVVFRRGISSAIYDLVLYILKKGVKLFSK